MAKTRIHQLAKELELNNKDLVTRLIQMGFNVKNHMSTLEDDEVTRVRQLYPAKQDISKPAQGEQKPRTLVENKPEVARQDNTMHEVRNPEGNGSAGNKTEASRPEGSRTEGRGPEVSSTEGNNPEANRPESSEPEINKPEVSKPEGNRPESNRTAGIRPEGSRSDGNRPASDRPVGSGSRPDSNRPASNRPMGSRPVGSGSRPDSNRPVGSRPAGSRPEGSRPEGNRPVGSRPVGSGSRPDSNRPVGNRPAGSRPEGSRTDGRRPDSKKYEGKRPDGIKGPMVKRPEVKKTEPKKDNAVTNTSERDVRKKALARKEELKRTQVQSQRKFLTKTVTAPTRGKKRHKGSFHVGTDNTPSRVAIAEQVSVQELANRLNIDAGELIKKLIEFGVMATINEEIDSETAALMAAEFGAEVEITQEISDREAVLEDTPDDPAMLQPKPPVITVMGHVDHGKTSVLDAIRETNITASEAGGITQHIGAYQVELKGKKVTFLDTPGHEAFTAMRARGAQVTDIAVLVVAADDGVMPQTVEAINHAKAAGVPIVVAINKIDKPDANLDRVKQQLSDYGLVAEEWGGETICAPVSARTKEGLDHLLEMLLLVAEMEEFKANPNRSARGSIVDAQLDKGRGPVATVLIQKGTLHIGDYVLAGTAYGKVRAMLDFKGCRIKKAPPSTPVEILGLSEVPNAGDIFYTVPDEKQARQIVEGRIADKRRQKVVTPGKITLEDLFNQIKEGKIKELNLIVKADVQGSVEALLQSLSKLGSSEVRVNVIHSGVGAITETDVMLASASSGLIIGFNVRPDANAKKEAELRQVEVRLYRVIYEALDDIKAALEGLLEPDLKEVILGRSKVQDTFKIPKVGAIAGCMVTEGKVVRNAKVRVIRDSVVIYEGIIASLRRFKDDVKEVVEGHECGIGLDKFQDLKEGDILEGYAIEEVKRVLL